MTAITKKGIIMTFLASMLMFTSCEKENIPSVTGEGYLRLSVNVDSHTDSVQTRALDEKSLPKIEDFKISIYKGSDATGTAMVSYDKFSDIDESISLSLGDYSVTASYGVLTEEGFDKPYFTGNASFKIVDKKDTSVVVKTKLANAMVNVKYTDAFKKYFTKYSTTLQSVGGSTQVVFAQDESRSAYFKPGTINVTAVVARQTGTSATLTCSPVEVEAQKEYDIIMDIKAGTSTIDITFNDKVTSTSVPINITENALTAAEPTITTIGFSNNAKFTHCEKRSINQTLQAYINAEAGIKSCVLKTTSATLIQQGWPAEIDLANMTTGNKTTLNTLGLTYKSGYQLSNSNKAVALVDFSKIDTHLKYVSGVDNTTSFTLTVTDKNSRVSTDTIKFSILTEQLQFTPDTQVTVSQGAKEINIGLYFNGGDPTNYIKAYYYKYGVIQESDPLTVTVILEEGKSDVYALKIDMGDNAVTSDQTLKLVYANGDEKLETELSVKVAN